MLEENRMYPTMNSTALRPQSTAAVSYLLQDFFVYLARLLPEALRFTPFPSHLNGSFQYGTVETQGETGAAVHSTTVFMISQ